VEVSSRAFERTDGGARRRGGSECRDFCAVSFFFIFLSSRGLPFAVLPRTTRRGFSRGSARSLRGLVVISRGSVRSGPLSRRLRTVLFAFSSAFVLTAAFAWRRPARRGSAAAPASGPPAARYCGGLYVGPIARFLRAAHPAGASVSASRLDPLSCRPGGGGSVPRCRTSRGSCARAALATAARPYRSRPASAGLSAFWRRPLAPEARACPGGAAAPHAGSGSRLRAPHCGLAVTTAGRAAASSPFARAS
jgi:hypothetical protein